MRAAVGAGANVRRPGRRVGSSRPAQGQRHPRQFRPELAEGGPAWSISQNWAFCRRRMAHQTQLPSAPSRRSEIVRAKDNVPVYSGA